MAWLHAVRLPWSGLRWNTICNRRLRLSRSTVGCYNAKIVLSNTSCDFEAVVSSTACFVAEHRPLHRKHLEKYDVQFRKFVRRIVGPPPPGTTWSAQWRDILHDWNLHADHWSHASGNSSWSNKCMTRYWNFACYIANFPAEHRVRRALAWKPVPMYPSCGRPQ